MDGSPNDPSAFTPALGHPALTSWYDAALRLFTRERRWRSAVLTLASSRAGDTILDVGCGTGTLALALARSAPEVQVMGLDPDPRALAIARAKAAKAAEPLTFVQGFARNAAQQGRVFNVVTCTLVLHQTPLTEKREGLAAMRAALRPGGKLLLADYGEQRSWLMRLLFRQTVQRLDGRRDTQPNADGCLPRLLAEVGFEFARVVVTFPTPSGSIDVIEARA